VERGRQGRLLMAFGVLIGTVQFATSQLVGSPAL
jgi:hypothetical protein